MKANCSRRHFIKAGAAGTFLLCSPKTAFTYTANEKIRFALIGIGGMGAKGVNIGVEEQVVAAADVDMQHAAKSVQKIKDAAPDAKFYTDYRKLFDEQKQLDAVWVATPDHHHFPATVRALADDRSRIRP